MAPVFKRALTQHASSSPPKSTQTGLVPVDEVKHKCGHYGTGRSTNEVDSLVYTSSGVFSQVLHSAPVEEQLAYQEMHEATVSHVTLTDDANHQLLTDKAAAKKECQWLSWSKNVIPSMIEPYLTLLRDTKNLSDMNSTRIKAGCTGCGQQQLAVSCIYFERRP